MGLTKLKNEIIVYQKLFTDQILDHILNVAGNIGQSEISSSILSMALFRLFIYAYMVV